MIHVQVDEVLNLTAQIIYIPVNLRTQGREVVLVNEDANQDD
jgi:hypothetical protein